MLADEPIVVGLDIGTTKVCAVVGEQREDRKIDIISVGYAPTDDGVRKGTIVDIDKTTQAITVAIEEAEKMADLDIESVFVGIAGAHITSLNSQGVVAIKGAGQEINADDVDRAVDNAKTNITIPHHQEIIHILPREFVVDEQKEILNPTGMVGSRLEAHVHIVTGAVTAMQNIVKCCEMAKLKVEEIVLQPYASSMAVLTEDEKKLGVVLVDIGGGTTDIIIFQNGRVVHSSCVPLGGQHVTNDLAIGLKTSSTNAERLKIASGAAMVDGANTEKLIEVLVSGGDRKRQYSQAELAEIVGPRMEEIFDDVKSKIAKAVSLDMLPAGVVMTGGTSLLHGCPELAEEILGLPVRRGYPINFGGLKDRVNNPIYATALGLIPYGFQNFSTVRPPRGFFGGLVERVASTFRHFFAD